MDEYDVRSDEESDEGPPELTDIETLTYEEVVQCCEWKIIEPTSIWGPERDAKTCYEPKVEGSRFCILHKCSTCLNGRSYKSIYCMECICPVVGCDLLASACGNRCSCCEKYHRSTKLGWRTCESCVCYVCKEGPLIERYISWGEVHLCKQHSSCVVYGCESLCGVDNPRYCPKHKDEICKRLRELELCLLRIKQSRDMRTYICNWYKWFLENFSICKICKGFYRDKCLPCENVLQKMIEIIALELRDKWFGL